MVGSTVQVPSRLPASTGPEEAAGAAEASPDWATTAGETAPTRRAAATRAAPGARVRIRGEGVAVIRPAFQRMAPRSGREGSTGRRASAQGDGLASTIAAAEETAPVGDHGCAGAHRWRACRPQEDVPDGQRTREHDGQQDRQRDEAEASSAQPAAARGRRGRTSGHEVPFWAELAEATPSSAGRPAAEPGHPGSNAGQARRSVCPRFGPPVRRR